VVEEALAAYDRGRRSIVPGRVFRWYMRLNRPVPERIKVRVAERMYRPR
jgi:hypothetical protein